MEVMARSDAEKQIVIINARKLYFYIINTEKTTFLCHAIQNLLFFSHM